ncbi:hypothetical protein N0V88_007624 [Collariella sp. IMI 366227]|nr:hypothetical protein N0V88_007624 [Collariella sp. IMI 366227]
MKGIRAFALLSLAVYASAQTIESLDPCGFMGSVRDCAKARCPPQYDETVVNAANAFCATRKLDDPDDLDDFARHIGVSTKAATHTTSTASSASAAATSEAPAASGSTGLSEAAKIGIGVGAGAAVIAILALAACLVLRKRRSRQLPPPGIDRYKISAPLPSDETLVAGRTSSR